jgi:hypothetical protein
MERGGNNMKYYRFRIELNDIRPPIWREFVVPPTLTLDEFHKAIQGIMGWLGCHLYGFTIDRKDYDSPDNECPLGKNCEEVILKDVVKKVGMTFTYTYDFGDNWRHKITFLEKNYENPDIQQEVYCLKGKGACPPEDCGGAYGYANLCKILKNPRHKEYASTIKWLGYDYDPKEFNIEDINDYFDGVEFPQPPSS